MQRTTALLKNSTIVAYERLKKLPFGKNLFALAVCAKSPYFGTIFPSVIELRSGHAEASLSQSWSLQNHIKTVHAIAVCNLVELVMGLIMEASIPPHLRWLPMGMDVDYLKKATGTLNATSTLADNFFDLKEYPGRVDVPVEVKNLDGVLVTKAIVKVWISKKPAK